MKKIIYLLSAIIGVGLMVSLNSCNKDDLTEKERLELLDSLNNAAVVQYTVNVVSGADAGFKKSISEIKGLSGAKVTVNRSGVLISATTNESGTAVFQDLRAGNVSVTIQSEGYTDVVYISNLTSTNNLNSNYTFASTIVPVFPISGEWVTEITGIVTYQSDLTNKIVEKANGVTVTATLDINSSFMNTFFPNNVGPGYVVNIAYSSVLMKTTTNANGEYKLSVPAAAQGLDILIDVAEVAVDQSIVLNIFNGEEVNGVQSIRTIFGNNSILPTAIPDVPGAYIMIGAPTGALGSYSQQAIFGSPVINAGVITSIPVINPGSGYTNTPNVIITGNGTGAQASTVLGAGGTISSITVVNGGSGYTNASAAPYITTYRENAKAIPSISTSGAISSVIITNSGKGYIATPTVTINSQTSVGSGATAVVFPNNISNGIINAINVTLGGSNYKQHANHPLNAENSNIPTTGLSVKAYSGKPLIRDLYLGTGRRTITY